ncbi:MAG: aminoacyl-histidine dipeptidase [Ruminococcus sp.]|nr:aminoacyl-histidine dipeptidase [Ruminococcus sp.]
MSKLENLAPHRVFHYFEELSSIHRGSGDMEAVSQYCVNFAKEHNLKYYTDRLNNVVIFKDGTCGYENSQPVILQGHLDMVCQKTEDCSIDFLNDGLDIYVDGDFVKAKGTTLGADNGIAVSMVLSVLESDTIAHPPIEAIFTTDEETGMYGAKALDMSILKGKRMINIDSEEDDCITVSCAGGSDFRAEKAIERTTKTGDKVTITLKGLRGGHSGIEINSGKLNANKVMGKALSSLSDKVDFEIISISGGDKPNAITNRCEVELCVSGDYEEKLNTVLSNVKVEFLDAEKDLEFELIIEKIHECETIGKELTKHITEILATTPNGVIEMSKNIENLVETSLNLGVLYTDENNLVLHFALRSNKKSGLSKLENDMMEFFRKYDFEIETFGHYPPWEYRENSPLRDMYKDLYCEVFKKAPRVEAIHAGLECGVFASQVEDFDCIAIGPNIFDAHTVNERLSIKSTQVVFDIIVKLLAKMQ